MEALREAKRTIQTMTWDEGERRSDVTAEQLARYEGAWGGSGKATAPLSQLRQSLPFAHPSYSAGLVLVGEDDVEPQQ